MADTLLTKNTKGTYVAEHTTNTYGTMYYVKDMKKAVALFRDTLGYKPSYESNEWTEFPINGHSICLHLSGGAEDQAKGAGILIINVSDIRGVLADLQKKDVKVSELHEVHPGAFSFNVKDADGNVFSFYEGPKSS